MDFQPDWEVRRLCDKNGSLDLDLFGPLNPIEPQDLIEVQCIHFCSVPKVRLNACTHCSTSIGRGDSFDNVIYFPTVPPIPLRVRHTI